VIARYQNCHSHRPLPTPGGKAISNVSFSGRSNLRLSLPERPHHRGLVLWLQQHGPSPSESYWHSRDLPPLYLVEYFAPHCSWYHQMGNSIYSFLKSEALLPAPLPAKGNYRVDLSPYAAEILFVAKLCEQVLPNLDQFYTDAQSGKSNLPQMISTLEAEIEAIRRGKVAIPDDVRTQRQRRDYYKKALATLTLDFELLREQFNSAPNAIRNEAHQALDALQKLATVSSTTSNEMRWVEKARSHGFRTILIHLAEYLLDEHGQLPCFVETDRRAKFLLPKFRSLQKLQDLEALKIHPDLVQAIKQSANKASTMAYKTQGMPFNRSFQHAASVILNRAEELGKDVEITMLQHPNKPID